MIPKHPWKLVPLAAVVALGLFMFGGGLSPTSVQADVSIDAADTLTSGVAFEFDVDADEETGDLTVTVSGANTTDLDLTLIECDGCDETDENDNGDGDPGVELIINTEDNQFTSGTLTFSLVADCEGGDTLTITVTQEIADPPNDKDEVQVECVEANVTIIKEAPDDPEEEFEFSVTASGSQDCEGSFTLVDGGSEGLSCEADVEYTLSEDVPDGFTVTIDCSDTGSPDIEIDEEAGEVVFTLGDDETIECTFVNEGGGGAPDTVTVSAAPNAVNCNSISFISIVVRDAGGQGVEDGTPITVATNIGSLNQTSTQTTGGGGGATVIFTAPANSGGTATVTATSGGKSGNATIQVNCAAATAVPPTVVPTAVPGTVTPPSTGDAGLADSGSSRQTTAGALLIAGSLLGGLAIVRRRA
jgi:hypothetical protein